ncbi:MAG: hypothetical protein U9Q73_01955 [Nanoarchaeota archaeon]|nr:hypothetical protein [Nanoarchaeota archaeon]
MNPQHSAKMLRYVFLSLMLLLIIWIVYVSSFSLIRTYSFSMLTLTLGSILDSREKRTRKILKYIIYILFFLYSLWSLGIFEGFVNLSDLDALDYTTIIFGIVAPVCMMIVGKKLASIKIKGYKIFNYTILWLIYFLILLLWWLIYPENIIMEFLFLFFIVSMIVQIYYINLNKGK